MHISRCKTYMYVKNIKQIINIKSSIQMFICKKNICLYDQYIQYKTHYVKYNHGKVTLDIVNQVTFTFRYH